MLPGRQRRRLFQGTREQLHERTTSPATPGQPSRATTNGSSRRRGTAADDDVSNISPSSPTTAEPGPAHVPIEFPLTDVGTRKLAAVVSERAASRRKLEAHTDRALKLLVDSGGAADVVRALAERRHDVALHREARRKREARELERRREEGGEDGDPASEAGKKRPAEIAAEKAVETLSRAAPELVKEFELELRHLIDAKAAAEDQKAVLHGLNNRVAAVAQQAVERKAARARERAERRRREKEARREQRRRELIEARRALKAEGGGAMDDAEDDLEVMDDEGSEEERQDAEADEEDVDEHGRPIRAVGPRELMAASVAERKQAYEAMTAYQRYAKNNDYIAFRQILHDSRNSTVDVPPPLPDASLWFRDDGTPVLDHVIEGGGGRGGRTAAPATKAKDGHGEDEEMGFGSRDDGSETVESSAEPGNASMMEDEELIVAGAVESIKCPLSLTDLTDPFTSKTCGHSFNRAAIFGYLKNATKICPQTGCNMVRLSLSRKGTVSSYFHLLTQIVLEQ